MTDKITINALKGVTETLLPVLYSRVVETKREDGIINDPIAVDWVSRIDYDFSKYDETYANHFGVAVRTEIFDEFTRAYLDKHPSATIVNIAAGLDTRFYRMDNGKLIWYELDLPESIAVRKQLMEETDRHRCLAASALDFSWVDEIEDSDQTLFIIEGLLMYFTEEQVRELLGTIAESFPDAHLLIEVMGYTQSQNTQRDPMISQTGAEYQWGIRETEVLQEWHDNLQHIRAVSIYDRHLERWLALPIEWKEHPSTYRNSVNRIVHLVVQTAHIEKDNT